MAQQCRVCGRDFDPLRFQVVVPGLGRGFDRVECAVQARALAGPAAAPAPLGAVVQPFPPPAATTAAAGRRPALVGANLALLAAGTAATAFLWARAFDAGPTGFELSGVGGVPAYERATVPAEIPPRAAAFTPPRTPTFEGILAAAPVTPAATLAGPEATPTTGGPAGGNAGPGGQNGGSGGQAPSPPPSGSGGDGPAVGPGPGKTPTRPAEDEDVDEPRELGHRRHERHEKGDDEGNRHHKAHEKDEHEGHGKATGHKKAHGKGHHGGPGKKKGHEKYDD